MSVESIQREFQNKVSKKVRLEPEGEDRYRVLTPFQFDDRDHLAIVLKHTNGTWILSD